MASVAAPRQPASTARTLSYTRDTGPSTQQPQQISTAAQAPNAGAPFAALALDCVAFSVEAGGTTTVTFPNLPVRNTAANPLDPTIVSQSPLSVQPQNHLLFTAFAQGETAHVSVRPVAVDAKNARNVGPFLGGSNTFLTFQAEITSTGPPASGFVVGQLHLAVG